MSGGGAGSADLEFLPASPVSNALSITKVIDNAAANGANPNSLSLRAVDKYDNAVNPKFMAAGYVITNSTTIDMAGVANVRINGGAVGAPGNCVPDASGACYVSLTSTVPGTYSSQVTAGGISIGKATFTFVGPTPPAVVNSAIAVSQNNALANGTATDRFTVTLKDASNNPVANTVVDFAATPDVRLGTATTSGVAGSCTTDAAGTCVLDATSLMAGSYSTELKVGTLSLGSLAYAFVADVASPSRSGVRVVTDNVPADSDTAVTLEVLLRDARNNPVAAGTVVNFQSSGADVAFNYGKRGAAGSCTTVGGTGICRVYATSSSSGGGIRSSVVTVTVGGVATALTGTGIVSGTATYGASPVLFTFTALPAISGRVFGDTGAGGGVANDGLMNGGEAGFPGVAVRLTDCGSIVHASTVSAGAGRYRLDLPASLKAGTLCIDADRGNARRSTGGSVANTGLSTAGAVTVAGVAYRYSQIASADRVSFAWTGSSLSGLDFGSVPPGSLVGNQLRNGPAGGMVEFPHSFTAGTAGSVRFSVTKSVASPATAGWSEQIYADPGCTRQLQKDAQLLYPATAATAQPMTAGQVLCILLRQSVPVEAALNSHNQASLSADFTFANNTGLSARYQLEDITTVQLESLALVMEVRNLTKGATAFDSNNQARSGETLEYRVTYSNVSPIPILNLEIHNTTPAFTSFDSALEGSTPASLTGCTKITPASNQAVRCDAVQSTGGHGAMAFKFGGSLNPGGTGSVLFRSKVD